MLDRYIKVLETVTAAGEPLSTMDIAEIAGLPRPTCYRLVSALMDVGFLESPADDGRYVLGTRFLRIALLGKSDDLVRRAIASAVEQMVVQTEATGFFSRYRGGRIDLMHIEVPSDPRIPFVSPGMGVRPAHACSSAKAIVAHAPDDIRDELLADGLERYTSKTLVDREAVLADLEKVRAQGYAICNGEIDDGVISVSVPIFVEKLGAIFSLGVVGPVSRLEDQLEKQVVPHLRSAAARASAAIQHCSVIDAEALNEQA